MNITLQRLAISVVFVLGSLSASAQEPSLGVPPPPGGYATPPPGAYAVPPPGAAAAPRANQPGAGLALSPSSDGLAWPPPGGRPSAANQVPAGTPGPREYGLGRPDAVASEQSAALAAAAASPPIPDRPFESTWYYRLDAFYWNERSGGTDFVNEMGPLSTIGYLHRFGQERIRVELFGGTVAYDGGAQFDDGSVEPYHESFGTNYLGLRGEYDLLIEPAAWSRIRLLAGVGTRFWIRNLQDAVTPSGDPVAGYDETWWTFYPYVGLETKDSPEPGAQIFGSARVGITPLTYQHVTYFDTTVFPRCGITARGELGVRYRAFSASAVIEAMTWGESAEVEGTFQPASRMLTVGGQVGYRF